MTASDADRNCPICGEPVETEWKICPACEAGLLPPACPQCGRAVREHWKRCPNCEARLLCPDCGRRLVGANGRCPDCTGIVTATSEGAGPALRIEPATGMEFVRVPGGEFDMGDTLGEGLETELPVHRVRLDGFYLGRYPVTQDQWMHVMPENPSRFSGGRHPVESVNFHDVVTFMRRLEAVAGGLRFDLPSEAQWEYAARTGGREELYAGGDNVDALAWYAENSEGRPHAVGGRRPNGLGLYDMSGNVWEWCRDVHVKDAYLLHAARNPVVTGPGSERVIRGGSWSLDAWSARCARRFSLREEDSGPGVGFRLFLINTGGF